MSIAAFPNMRPLDRPLTITTFRDRYAKTKKEHTKSLRQIVPALEKRSAPSKDKLPWLKRARFGDKKTAAGSLRHNANVNEVRGVEIDYDLEEMPMREAAELFQKLEIGCLFYTSPSHKPGKPRWRGLFPLSAPVAPSERGRFVAWVNGVLGGVLKGDSFALSQSYYYGKVNDNPDHEVIVVDERRYLDDADEFDAGAMDPGDADQLEGDRHESDTTNSGHGLKLAGRIARNGGTKEDFEEAIPDHPGAAAWVAKGGQRQIDRAWAKVTREMPKEVKTQKLGLNEDGLAKIFAARFRHRLRYCRAVRRWYKWSGARWKHEETGLAFDWAGDTCRELRLRFPADETAGVLAKARTADAVEKFAQADRAFAVKSDIWDRDLWLLGTPAGTVDLRTGELRAARQKDYITKLTAVGPAGEFDPVLHCPRWERFLNESTGADADSIRFLQQWCGYCLTGDISEEALLFIFGRGGNGKSVFLDTIAWVLGDYAQTAPMETFAKSNFDRHSTEIAMLWGARLVTVSETEEGRAWAESRIKQLTGGDRISARFMRQDNFTFTPQFKLMFIGNNQPRLHNTDAAERRRFNMMPFDRTPIRENKNLKKELREE